MSKGTPEDPAQIIMYFHTNNISHKVAKSRDTPKVTRQAGLSIDAFPETEER